MSEQFLYEVQDRVAIMTINRPDALNTFNAQMVDDLKAAFDEADANDDVRAIVVTGAGKAFCAGADLSSDAGDTFNLDDAASEFDAAEHLDPGGFAALRVLDSVKPVIGAINGVAAGIGATITLPMDFRLASETARFGFVFTKRGLVAECASSWFLPRAVGHQTAAEWIYTGRVISAADAHAAGLVRSIHAPGELLDAAFALGREIAANTSPVAVAISKRLLWEMAGAASPRDAHRLDSEAVFKLGRSAEVREGVAAFLERRSPAFPLRITSDLDSVSPDWSARRNGS
ncbi:enoyl-CoA hydratase-related protein [Rhodococcoides yunnanense]|uniref:enoyl-CoA hydratase-related protein n=1 Tax=Rhodococcoides yunnanense TaxID=278209 RepID=UPI000934DFD6|nr:enoyl-CoA hydratase-related protein [Rhodococcus yunnanensis]